MPFSASLNLADAGDPTNVHVPLEISTSTLGCFGVSHLFINQKLCALCSLLLVTLDKNRQNWNKNEKIGASTVLEYVVDDVVWQAAPLGGSAALY